MIHICQYAQGQLPGINVDVLKKLKLTLRSASGQ